MGNEVLDRQRTFSTTNSASSSKRSAIGIRLCAHTDQAQAKPLAGVRPHWLGWSMCVCWVLRLRV